MDFFLLLIFVGSYFAILNDIGLRTFTVKDWYKVVFPFHVVIYLRSRAGTLHYTIAFVHIASITSWVVKYII